MEPQWEKYYSVLKAHIKAAIDDTIVDNIIPHIRLTKGIDIPLNGLLKENSAYENALFNLVNACIDELKDTYYVVLENPIESSEDRNKENLDKIFNSKPIKSSSKESLVKSLMSLDKDRLPPAMTYSYLSKYAKERGYTYNDTKDWTAGEWLIFLNTYRPKSVKSSKPIKSSTYQFVAEFDGKYQPRIIDYMFKNGNPSWTDANEDYSNGKVFTEQELPKVVKQLERYYAETGGGASDIEIVRDDGDSVYLEEFLQEGSFDKAWEKAVAEYEAWEKEHFWDKED